MKECVECYAVVSQTTECLSCGTGPLCLFCDPSHICLMSTPILEESMEVLQCACCRDNLYGDEDKNECITCKKIMCTNCWALHSCEDMNDA